MLDYEIQNFAPDMDVINVAVFDKNTQEMVQIGIFKVYGKTHIRINHTDSHHNQCDLILGEESET